MAAKYFYRQGFLLLLFNFISTAALEKRFSDFKRCADEECSMLLCRGKAVKDFTGPDCRFLSFKKSDTVYVYYKLSGRRADMWAGSVGSNFGYFPKDLIAINHLYTEHEHEIPAEETDFVCFDTGFSSFESYDVDSLLAPSPVLKVNENKATTEEIEDTLPLKDGATGSESQAEQLHNFEENVTENQSASTIQIHQDAEIVSQSTHEIEQELVDVTERLLHATKVTHTSAPKRVLSEGNENKDIPEELIKETSAIENVAPEIQPENDLDFFVNETQNSDKKMEVTEEVLASSSEHAQISDLKTTLGTTFDAVTTDDEVTKSVTPSEDEESKPLDNASESEDDDVVGTPLLTSSEDAALDKLVRDQSLPDSSDNKQEADEEKNMWTSLGDAVFSVVTGVERTASDVGSDEDDEDDEEEEELEVSNEHKRSRGAEKEVDDPAPTELREDSQHAEPAIEQLLYESTPQVEKDLHIKPEMLSVGSADGRNKAVTVDEDTLDEMVKPIELRASLIPPPADPVSPAAPLTKETDLRDAEETLQQEEGPKDSGSGIDGVVTQDDVVTLKNRGLVGDLAENQKVANQELSRSESHTEESTRKMHLEKLVVEDVDILREETPNQVLDSVVDFESNATEGDLFVEEPVTPAVLLQEEIPVEEAAHIEQEEKEELMEDENALYLTQSNDTDSEEVWPDTASTTMSPPEPLYSDSVLRLTLLRDHFSEERMEQVQKLIGLKNLFKVEAMFSDLEVELQATRRSHTGAVQDVERALEAILEASENTILDEIEKMLDSLGAKYDDEQSPDQGSSDVETEILDDFQELAFSLRQKYSTASDSAPLTAEEVTEIKPDAHDLNVQKDKMLHVAEVTQLGSGSEVVTEKINVDYSKGLSEIQEAQTVLEEEHSKPHVTVKDDRGHSNKNQEDQLSFKGHEESPGPPQDTLESPIDVEVEHLHPATNEEVSLISTGMVYISCFLSLSKRKTEEWTFVIISQLPEEWKPGETFYGCPWQVVVITVLVGVVSFTMFFWRTIFPVKKKEYLVDEKKLAERIQALKKEKDDALTKVSALQKQTEQLKENQKLSKEEVSITLKRIQDLEGKVSAAQILNDNMLEEKSNYIKLLEEEREASLQNKARVEKLEKSNENLKHSRKKIQEAHAKNTILLDEAKIREDARSVQYKVLEKGHTVLKDENKTLKGTIKDWEDKHKELNEQMKVYQKSLKELEDSVVLKDHNVEVLSELLADLDACDSQKDAKSVANGELPTDKKTLIKNRIKQMMDVSRVQTTLSVVEEERDRFMAKLLGEEKNRKSLEEQHQEMEHAIATLKGEKSHVENQLKILQQKNEIMVEMYQQKENALQQRLTKEELERRSKESMLSEVGGKALEAEEQVKVLRQRINEMEEQMKKTEEVYKEQIKEQENKTHSNWVNARNAERALNQEKMESSKLRQSLAVLTTQLNERRAPLFRPNTGPPAGARQGDSYGPSPVSGGAPSPPLMIEGPRRPPSAPVGRRTDPYGPRPPSDPHGRYAENKHMSGMDMMGPRSSSPANMDIPQTHAIEPQVKAEAQADVSPESSEPGPGSFLASPIRDSPGPGIHGPPPGSGPHDQLLAHGLPPPGRFPPPGQYRPPRPGPYQLPPGAAPPPMHGPPLPANGHHGIPMLGPPNGHPFPPRPGPGLVDPRGPMPPHFRPPPPHHFGPMPLPPGVRGPIGPRPPVHPDMRHPVPLLNMPPGAPHYPGHGDALQQPAGNPGLPQRDASQDSQRPAMAEP